MIGMSSGTEIVMTEKGWVTEEAFKKWLEHFNRYRTKGKVILILDGHVSHTNLTVVDLCEASEIELVLILPHTSHALQSLDVSFFKLIIIKNLLSSASDCMAAFSPRQRNSKIVFGSLLKETWNLSTTVENATKGFLKTEIYPLNPCAIPAEKFVGDNTTYDFANYFTDCERLSTSDDAQPSISASIEIDDTIEKLLPIPEIITIKRTKATKKTILHLTSSENKKQLLQKI